MDRELYGREQYGRVAGLSRRSSIGWNRAKIAVWGGKQEAERHCRVAPSRRFVNMAICTKMGQCSGAFLCILLNFIFGTLYKFDGVLKENFVKNAELYFIFSTLYKTYR